MKPFLFFKKSFLSFCFLSLLLNNVASQETSTAPETGFSYEIGLDFSPFVRGQQGFSLIYKRPVGPVMKGKFQKQTALRLLAGFHRDEKNDDMVYQIDDTTNFKTSRSGDENWYFFTFGMERRLRSNKSMYYFGFDLGPHFGISKWDNQQNVFFNTVLASNNSQHHESKIRRAELTLLGGYRYFLHPRFSIGIEIGSSFILELTHSKLSIDGQDFHSDDSNFAIVSDLPRLLYLSFNF